MPLEEKAKKIRAIILDIDGVLTNGQFGYSASDEIKFFHARDGTAVVMARRAGLIVGAISGREAEANRRRAKELGFDFLYEGKKEKQKVFEEILARFNLTPAECLYIGDDVQDAAIIQEVGIGVFVGDAPDYLDQFCDMRTRAPGGFGAVREVVDWLLQAQGKWQEALKAYGITPNPA
jgi:3-deoxy-D-manno-octulosonate 8-phosphate phosphatase (KDO 8-P phosphatase)